MRILLSAYACEPGLGSEEGVGWNMALEVAKHHETWVLTRTFSRPAIEAILARNPVPNLHFVYFEPLDWSEDWKNTQGAVQLHYYLWQVWAYFTARSLHNQVKFDLAQHITYVKYWSPSFLSLLPIPFIWGPVGGGESAPKNFWKDFSRRGKIYEALRLIAQRLGEQDPFTRLTAQRSTLALASTNETAERLRAMKVKHLQIVSQVALSEAEINSFARCPLPEGELVRFVSMGRLLHWKGIHLGLRAFAAAKLEQAEYWIIGEGPERQRLELLAIRLGIAAKVKFLGRIPREQVFAKLGQCHVLVHPSLHDSGGQVCSEMMAAGRPVICLDLGGPGVQVTKETGIKVPAYTPDQATQELAAAMTHLASNPSLRMQMGRAGRAHVKAKYSWGIKGKAFTHLYQEVLNRENALDGRLRTKATVSSEGVY